MKLKLKLKSLVLNLNHDAYASGDALGECCCPLPLRRSFRGWSWSWSWFKVRAMLVAGLSLEDGEEEEESAGQLPPQESLARMDVRQSGHICPSVHLSTERRTEDGGRRQRDSDAMPRTRIFTGCCLSRATSHESRTGSTCTSTCSKAIFGTTTSTSRRPTRSAVSSRLPVPSLPGGRADAVARALILALAFTLDYLLADSHEGTEEGGGLNLEQDEVEKEQDEAGCRSRHGWTCSL